MEGEIELSSMMKQMKFEVRIMYIQLRNVQHSKKYNKYTYI